jgi:hypothetical protein
MSVEYHAAVCPESSKGRQNMLQRVCLAPVSHKIFLNINKLKYKMRTL